MEQKKKVKYPIPLVQKMQIRTDIATQTNPIETQMENLKKIIAWGMKTPAAIE